MFMELIDSLRCTQPHEDTWLVAAFDRVEARDVQEGQLGCPVCRARYPIRGGMAFFDIDPAAWSAAALRPEDGDARHESDQILRTAALLGLSEPGGSVVLAGSWARYAAPLADLIDVRLLVVNPDHRAELDTAVSMLVTRDVMPLAPGSVRAVALDVSTASTSFLESATRALRPGGRLVAPAQAPLPHDTTELARDDDVWVAERGAAVSRPVQLGSARRR